MNLRSGEPVRVAAIDVGASSGRVVVGTVGQGLLDIQEVHRFDNGAVSSGGRLQWDITRIFQEIVVGLGRAAETGPIHSVGIDSWAIDYGLLDNNGGLMGNPFSHRDSRTVGVREDVIERVGLSELYTVTGLQQLPFSTLYQVMTEGERLEQAGSLLLIPDLLAYWLTGHKIAERTNASTTAMYDVRRRQWATELIQHFDIPAGLLPALADPGTRIGPVSDAISLETGLDPQTPVVAVGSHDTASAVVAAPFEDPRRSAYISSGTWSLVGVELGEPVLTDAAREADFTNEGGVDGTIRFLRNVSGLWVLSECLRTWAAQGASPDLDALLAEAAEVPALKSVIDLEHPDFLPPGDMPARIQAHCNQSNQVFPRSYAEVVRCIIDSLALAFARTLKRAAELTAMDLHVVHLVGGGARNALLCQATADACRLPVVAGPVEASAIGNIVVQARAMGADLPDLASMRALVKSAYPPQRYEPRWEAAQETTEVQPPAALATSSDSHHHSRDNGVHP